MNQLGYGQNTQTGDMLNTCSYNEADHY